jgi:hypothetical protein
VLDRIPEPCPQGASIQTQERDSEQIDTYICNRMSDSDLCGEKASWARIGVGPAVEAVVTASNRESPAEQVM